MRITGRKLRPEEKTFIDKLYLEMAAENALFRYANKFIIDKAFVDDVSKSKLKISFTKDKWALNFYRHNEKKDLLIYFLKCCS